MSPARWVYDPAEQRLYLEGDTERREVTLSPQQHRLMAYMAQRNRAEAGKAVLCGREELISAIWGDEPGRSSQDLAYVVHQLRVRLAVGPPSPELIVNERGRGYRLLATTAEVGGRPTAEAPAAGSRRRVLLTGLALAGVLAAGLIAFVAFSRPAEPILREGSRGEDVLALQRDLIDVGYDPVYVDGQYGPLTARAVRIFQQDHGLVVDGEVGPDTRRALRQALDSRRATSSAP